MYKQYTHEMVVRKQEYLIIMLFRVHVTSQFPYIDRIIKNREVPKHFFDTTPNIKNIEFTILTLFHATSKSELKSKIQNQDGIKTCTFTDAMN